MKTILSQLLNLPDVVVESSLQEGQVLILTALLMKFCKELALEV